MYLSILYVVVAVSIHLMDVIAIVHHYSVRLPYPVGGAVSQPVEPPDGGSVSNVEVRHTIQSESTPLCIQQVPDKENAITDEVLPIRFGYVY